MNIPPNRYGNCIHLVVSCAVAETSPCCQLCRILHIIKCMHAHNILYAYLVYILMYLALMELYIYCILTPPEDAEFGSLRQPPILE